MGIKTLGTVIGHVSSATTLNAYTHIVDAMWHSTSDKSDQGTGVETYAPFSNRKSYGILAKRCESSAIHETAFIPGIRSFSSCSFKPVFGAYGILTLLEPGKALFIWHSSFLYIDPVRGSYAESASPAPTRSWRGISCGRSFTGQRVKRNRCKSVPAPGRKFLYRQGSCVAVYVAALV